ncbi:hypothetical protein BH23ACT5_BH23ACT5_11670 [soil metagenome]
MPTGDTWGVTPAMITALLLVLATGAWSAAMAVMPPGTSGTGTVLVTMSMWTATVTSIAGMLVARSRWAQRLGGVIAAAHGVVATLRPIDVWWMVALGLSAGAAVALAGPWLAGEVRTRPSATGPPPRAVLVPLLLVATPLALGLARGDDVPAAVVGAGALLAAFTFVRALPGALWAVRVVWPALAVALAVPMGGTAPAALSFAASVSVAAMAWHSSVARSVRPLVRRGSVVPVPPELAPRDVLGATGLDDRGRPR